jgi:hypothetical protein
MTRRKRRQRCRLATVAIMLASVSAYAPSASAADATVAQHRTAIGSGESTPKSNKPPSHDEETSFPRHRYQRRERIKKTREHNLQDEQKHKLHNSADGPTNRPQSSIYKARYLNEAEGGCTLCYDGSAVSNSNQQSSIYSGWTCGDLETFVRGTLRPREPECLEFQAVGSSDCGCPTAPLDDDYCAMCAMADGSAQLIPDYYLDLPIPVTDLQPSSDLTCQDLVFVPRSGGVIPCDSLAAYMIHCGCPSVAPASSSLKIPTLPPRIKPPTLVPIGYETIPPATMMVRSGGDKGVLGTDVDDDELVPGNESETDGPGDGWGDTDVPGAVGGATGVPRTGTGFESGDDFACFVCPDQKLPQNLDRILPFLAPPPAPQSNTIPPAEATTTCGMLASMVESVNDAAKCFELIYPSVPVDLQSFCGCSNAKTWDFCSLCEEGQPLANPDLNVPGTGGLTCIALQEYMRFITAPDSCSAMAETARETCCTPLPDCPVCGHAMYSFAEDKLYPPFGLTCSELRLAEKLGNDVTCREIQETFEWYCECPNAVRPSCRLCDSGGDIPEPEKAIPAFGPGVTCKEVDDYASLRTTDACDDDITSWSVDTRAYCGCPDAEPPGGCRVQCRDDFVINTNALVPASKGMSVNSVFTCGDLFEFAPFVIGAELCSAMQESAKACCVREGGKVSGTNSDLPEEPPSDGRRAPIDSYGFLVFPFFNNVKETVHEQRTYIVSPYGSPNYPHRGTTSAAWQHQQKSKSLLALLLALVIVVTGTHSIS